MLARLHQSSFVNTKFQIYIFLLYTGSPLFLTPLLKAGKIKEAQKAATVNLVGPEVKSYSGYFTVGLDKCGSNLFFWFFPAMVSKAYGSRWGFPVQLF